MKNDSRKVNSPKGFTTADVTITVSIIAVLIALLLPAVQKMPPVRITSTNQLQTTVTSQP